MGVSVLGLYSLKLSYVTYDLATFPEETFNMRSGNAMETVMAGKRSG